ncbi:MAG: dockerin type I repeat-containing protein [Oscillospiraceae bacterium]|nr:dockerin type I repeat-containing protein [Oscillospiraceae bacterium]
MKFKGKMTILAAVLSAIAMVFAISSAASANSNNDSKRYLFSTLTYYGQNNQDYGKVSGSVVPSNRTPLAGETITVTVTPGPNTMIGSFSIEGKTYIGNSTTSQTISFTVPSTLPQQSNMINAEVRWIPISQSGSTSGSTPEPTPMPTPEITWKMGDVNLDGKVNASDATLILKYSVGLVTLSGQRYINADVNGDDRINAQDATEILRTLVGRT